VGITTSEQARELATRPRITAAEEEQMISLFADGYSTADVASQFPTWSQGTIANRKTGWKSQIEDLRRARSVQFTDIPGVRKPARVNDYWELRTIYKFLIQKHLESCYAADPVTGVLEFVEQLVDFRKLKTYSGELIKANRMIESEMGQQVAPMPSVDKSSTSREFSGADGAGGVDYGELAVKHAEWVARAPERERAKAVREEWHWHEMQQRYASVTDFDTAREEVQRDKDKASGMSPTEWMHAIWERSLDRKREKNYEDSERFCATQVTAALAEYGPDSVAAPEFIEDVKWSLPQDDEVRAEIDAWFAGPSCAALVEAARKPALESEAAPGPPPGPNTAEGEWVLVDD
jgi:hypothetical protein